MQSVLAGFRLSVLQRRLWRSSQDPKGFLSQAAVVLSGPLDQAVLETAIRRTAEQHEVLRTVFPRLPGMDIPLQEVKEIPSFDFREDGDGLPLAALLAREAGRELDLERGPLFLCTLCPVAPQSSLLLLTLPAVCGDAETMYNLVREIARHYQATLTGASPDRELTQYIDFSEWQNDLGEMEESEKGRTFWKQQNLAALPALELPFAAPSSPTAGGGTRRVVVEIGSAAGADARAEQALLLAAWKALLWRLTGQERLAVSTFFDGRRIEPLREALGLFGSYLPVLTSLRDDLRLSQLAEELRGRLEAIREWQEYFPWDAPGGIADAQYLSSPQIGFEYRRWPEGIDAGPLTFELRHLSGRTERFRLLLSAVRKQDRLSLELSYDGSLYDELEMRRLAQQLEALLASSLAAPETLLGELDLLGEAQRQQLLREWNDSAGTTSAAGEGLWLHRRFEQHAARQPEATAVVGEGGDGDRLSFGVLNARANRLARHLRRLGVEVDSRVGLFADRSAEMLVGILGVMKVGGGYVPLDPMQPRERLRLMVEELGLRVVLARRAWRDLLPVDGLEVVEWEGLEERLAGLSDRDLGIQLDGDNLAYVLFTSGSTGRPKGVMVRHGGLANLALALEQRVYAGMAWEGTGRVGVNAPLVFDGSVKQLAQLAWGRTLHLVPEAVRPDGEALWGYLREQRVEVVDSTPSQLRLLLEGGLEGAAEVPLRRVLVGGEEIGTDLWRRLEASPWVEYHNVYGPTECTVDATAQRVAGDLPSIGRPLLNVRVYVVDRGLRPVSVGLSGELCVGGAGLARGYAGRPELTAERFIPDPFSGEPGGRLYRTGDLGRLLDDGRVEFLGRIDHQVKLRGVRIELGEIESVLGQHPRVRSAVAAVREDRPGDRRLVGYVVQRAGGSGAPGGRPLHALPNGMSVAQLNRIETDYLYREIFEQSCYLRHGVTLPEDACVLDVGANIGMFSLFVSRQSPRARIFAFEPIGEIFETLRFNASRCQAQVSCFPHGLAEEERIETFTYYPQFSARSGLSEYADARDEVEVIKRYIGNEQRLGVEGAGELLEQVDELVAGRFQGELLPCRVRRLSQVIREEGIDRVDLLKVDVQRAELRVLEGVDDADWSRIGQVAMEVHDAPGGASEGRVERIVELLSRHGFQVVVEQDELLAGTDRYNVFAVREGFDDWRSQRPVAVRDRGLTPLVEVSPAPGGAASEGLYTLPNHLRINQQNRNESDFIYQQIFVDQVYQRHGIEIREGDCLFDVGANIGLFTLYAHQWPGVQVHAFEPIPSNFEKLASNVQRYGCPAHLYPCGLGRQHGRTRFTFYPKWSASSGQYADPSEDLESARVFLLNRDRDLESYADEILDGRFQGETVECELRTLSEVIRESGVERIDLLKLDVEKSELDILLGLEEEDWPKVQQAVLEVHDIGGRLELIHDLLARHGFEVVVEQDELATGTGIYNLYARRPGLGRGQKGAPTLPAVEVTGGGPELTVAELQAFLRERLPEFMLPSDLVLLEALPYTRSGKVDRRALPAPEEVRRESERPVVAPRDPFEEVLAGIWSEVLQKSPVSIDDNFFELGGHSLLATQLVSRVRSAFSIDLPLRTLFERPTVAELALEVRQARDAGQGLSAPPIVPVPRTGDLPLSFAQQRLWFIDQLEPGSPAYNCPHPQHLTGALDPGLLSRTLQEVIRRHESLRTRFASVDGRPVQIIDPPAPLPVPWVDLTGLAAGPREREAQRLMVEDARRPFDLARGPLLRVAVVRLGAEEHAILFTMHHVVSDGRSMEVLVREVTALYGAFLEGRPSPLPELGIQYADFAAWQRNWLSGEVLAAEIDHWRRRLAGAPPVLDLPLDRPRSAMRRQGGGHSPVRLDVDLAQALRQLSRRQGTTLFMTLLAGFEALLARYSHQDDLCVGVPVAGRDREETEKLIGFFINTLVMRGDLSGSPGFLELLGRVKDVALEAYAHQDVPFEKLVEELAAAERSLASSPLFQVMFALEDNPRRDLQLPGIALRQLQVEETTAKFDLMLGMLHLGEDIAGTFGYSTALFDAATIERMAEHLRRLLEGIARDPAASVLELPLLTEEQWHQVTAAWSEEAPRPAQPSFHEIFAAHAAERPEAVALEAPEVKGREWSYGELNRRANQLAHRLRELGVGPEERVGLCLERSAELVISLLAVLKAGGAFVPLDPSYPESRRAWIAQDAALSVLVTSTSVERPLGDGISGVRVLALETEEGEIARQSEQDPARVSSPQHLAYLIYTSGTTGQPKGVMVEHRQWMQTLSAAAERFGPRPDDRMACLASFSFDISLLELGLPLLAGGRVLLVGRDEVVDPVLLAERLAPVTLLHGVPSLMRPLVEALHGASQRLDELRTVFVGGEAVETELLSRMREVLAPARLVVLYGPTESTIICASHEVPRDGEARGRRLGQPLPGVELRLVDRTGLLVPLGVAGDLWVGGPGVSRGYLGRPELTADRYRPAAGGERFYRTGDLARYANDGTLEFLGRADGQIKVRGFRIEPGEVEAVLQAHPQVRSAAVVVRVTSGDSALVAFVAGDELEEATLREHVSRSLPPHMVPSLFVVLEELPLLPNGKVDRRGLAQRDLSGLRGPREWVAPRTPAEELMAGLWAGVLGRERVGIHDSFFELGGHSLLATQLVSRLRQAFGVELPLRALFESPTVAGLSRVVEEAQRAGQGLAAPPIVPVPRGGGLPLSFAQERLWFIEQITPGTSLYHVPMALELEGDLDLGAVTWSLSEVVRRHEALRTRFLAATGRPVQVIDEPEPVPVPVIDGRGMPEAELRRVLREEASRPFDLAQGPLLRALLLRIDERRWWMLLNLHHIVSDGWSVGVLVREVSALYAAWVQDREAALPALPVQYADFAHWQREWLSGEVLETEMSYWRQRLAGAPPLLELPLDRPRPAVLSPRGATARFTLPASLSAELAALTRRTGATLFMTLLAGFQALLWRWSGRDDLTVGTPIAGRNRAETEGLIGFFVNTLVLRARIDPGASFTTLLGRAREEALGAYTHQDVPFEKLVEELAPQRSLAYSPLFQVMLTVQEGEREELALPDLRLRQVELDSGVAKFDLILAMSSLPDGKLAGGLNYNTSLFDTSTAARLVRHLETLLVSAAASPESRLDELVWLRQEERHQLLAEWSDSASPYPQACVHALFEERARLHPERLAVELGDEQVSYGELNRRANRLAHRLRSRGVEAETRVGLCVERSAGMVVGMLGILKAGGAYVPLDPGYPAERLAAMVEDAAVSLVVGEPGREQELPSDCAVLVPADWERLPDDDLPLRGWPDSTAYVTFTSGSTGRPKGSAIPHRAVVRLVRDTNYINLGPDDRLAQISTVTFDAATFEVWGALLNGGVLVGIPREVMLSPAAFAEALAMGRISAMFVTAALFNQVAREVPSAFAPVRRVLVGGEAVDPRWMREVLEKGRPGRLQNAYGPTEATTFSAWQVVEEVAEGVSTIPIGRPLSNAQAYVVDGEQRPVPVGVTGELLLGGDGLARGYERRPDLTAASFVPDGLSGVPGARLYRTGDVARWDREGRIEYLGRRDHQVKVRGFRIELPEIEAVLSEHPAVSQAVALARQVEADGWSDRQLVAWVVPADAATAGAELGRELRRYVGGRLPAYMVPALVMAVPELPLTPTGKVDRRALLARAWSGEEPAAAGELVAPRTPYEELVAQAWEELLSRRVGVDQDFFELGGHSLLATQVVSRLQRMFDLDIPLRALFENPTVARLARYVERAQLAGLHPSAPPIVPVPRDGNLPLSFSQERLWLIDQITPGSPLYNVPIGLELEGDLAVEAVVWSLSEVARRHEALRTRFLSVDGRPVQIADAPAPVAVPVVDGRGAPESELRRLMLEEARRPFDLARGPLLRLLLLRVEDGKWWMLLNLHHIVSDGWSMGVLVREVSALYTARVDGQEAKLPELPVQYADFARWQREWLSGQVLEQEMTHWRQHLAGAPPLLALPLDRPRPPVLPMRGDTRRFVLPRDLSAELTALGRRTDATLFMTLLAGFQALLWRWSGQPDLTIGTPIAGRNRVETEGLIGFFVNTLVLRGRVDAGESFTWLLGRAREEALAAYTHQDVPFEKLVEELAPQRSLAHSPLFQVMFTMQEGTRDELPLPGLRLRQLELDPEVAKFELALGISMQPDGRLGGAINYNTALFDASTAARLVHHLELLLASATASPEGRLDELVWLDEAEQHQILTEWRASAEPAPQVCVHELFEEWARRHPELPAVETSTEQASYGELNRRANRLAHLLRARGVRPETPVGLCVERSVALVVGMLGILKAGGVYVPLDPSYPSERLAMMMADAGVALVVIEPERLGELPDGWEMLLLGEEEGEPETDPEPVTSPGHMAYLIYTSGTTDRPRGVMVEHRQWLHTLSAAAARFGPQPGDRMACLASFAFDISLLELMLPLLAGGRVLLVSREELLNPPRLVELLAPMTLLHGVPSLMRHAVEWLRSSSQRLEALRTVFVGGEAVEADLLARMREVLAPARQVVLYGPTEATIICASHEVPASEEPRGRRIGRPLPGVEMRVMDPAGRMVPVGVEGELWVGGPGVSRGYLGRPELTADRFRPAAGGGRFYRTGDLARHTSDGTLEFLGRADGQVKVRGFRVEPGEIEMVIQAHPRVRDAAVVVRTDGGDSRLVAYVVGDELDGQSLRDHVSRSLPPHMLPSLFLMLKALPLLPNGKVDRRDLEQRDLSGVQGPKPWVAPRTPTEDLMAGLWAEVLERERVGAEDDFFELGGHSLLATQLISRVRHAFGVELPLQTLFKHPTVAGLSRAVEEALRAGRGLSAPSIVPVPRDADLPLSFAQERLWFHHQLQPGSILYNLPTALRVSGDLQVPVLWRSFDEIERRHEALRTVFTTVDGRPFQRIDPPSTSGSRSLVDLRALPAERRQEVALQIAMEEARRPFDLERGPLLRLGLLRLDEQEHAALLTMHHIISDQWSMGIFFRELSALYDAFAQGRPSPLPDLPVQYADYSHWQRQWLSGETLERQVAYWRQQLAGAPPVLDLPLDRPRPPVQRYRGAITSVVLPAGLAEPLRRLCRSEGVTLFMAFLALYQALLARLTNSGDISVGTAVSGRGRLEVEGLIGFFVNTLVLRGRLEDGPGFRELLRRARGVMLEAYEFQDLPFEKLVEELRPVRSLAHSPLFQVMLVVQNATSNESFKAPYLTLSPLTDSVRDPGVQFDLTLLVQESGEGLATTIQYRNDLFDEGTILRMLAQLARLMEAGLADPDRALAEVELLSEEERQQAIREWNASVPAAAAGTTVVELIRAQAARTPSAPALLFEGRSVPYEELVRRSDRLARHLRQRGCGRGMLVGVLGERSPERVIAFLAILTAGGAYLPLDPTYPRQRLALLLRDCGADLVLSEERLVQRLPEDRPEVLFLDREPSAIGGTPEAAAGPEPGDIAYVIYTSGSTGGPKGALLRHRGLANVALELARVYHIGAGDRVLQFASVSFDASVAEIVMTLCAGATLCLASRDSILPGEGLAAVLRDLAINVATLPPSVLAVTPSRDLPRLHTLGAVGESLPPRAVEGWSEGRRVVNAYGPTEITVCATASEGVKLGRQHASIGRPLQGVAVFLLDARLLPVPLGVAGELCAGGPGVAVGYLGRPDLTAARFIPNPFSAEPGDRLYRTGDLARQLPDGSFEFLGRIDRQVKLRGFRIELEEIEAALLRQPGVSQAAVVMRQAGADDLRLVAYVAPRDGESPTAAELRAALEAELPAFMVPSTFAVRAELPLTESGKLDRNALPALDEEAAGHAHDLVAPRDPLEATLTEIWQDLLGVRPIGVRDNFFERGGHSLLAVRLMSRIEQETGQKLPLSALFQAPTIEALANLIRAREKGIGVSCLVPLQPKGSLPPLFLTHPVGGNLFSYRSLVGELGDDRPVYGLQSAGLDGSEAPFTTIEDMAHHYLEEMRRVQPQGPYFLCGWSSGGTIAYEMARLLREQGEEVAHLVLIDTRVPDENDRSILRNPAHLLSLFAMDFGIPIDRFKVSWQEVSDLPTHQQLSYVLDAAKAEGVVPPEIEVGQVLRYFQIFKTNLEAMASYRPQPYPGRMTLIRVTEAQGRDRGPAAGGGWRRLSGAAGRLKRQLQHRLQLLTGPALGWHKLVRDGVEVLRVPGSHFSVLRPPHAKGLAERLRLILSKEDSAR